MKRLIHVAVLLGVFGSCYGQNWLSFSPPHFLPQVMKQSEVGFVNIYEIPPQSEGDEASDGRVIRVVKYPIQSFSFDEEGRMIEKLIYKKGSDAIASKSEMNYLGDQINEKHTRVYLYNPRANGSVDTLIAMHLIHRYAYDEDRLIEITVSEKNKEGQAIVEEKRLSYSAGKEIQKIENKHFTLDNNYTTRYEHHANGLSYALWNDGGKTTIYRDKEDRFVRVKKVPAEDSNQVSETEYFYKDSQLDSTHATYHNGEIEIGGGYYYDLEGKLVMIRIHHSEQGLTEKLFEYFPREKRN